jgi:pimeloyl-ACP methyl ester carboxylesterase
MAIFDGPDGTRLAYHRSGEGDPLVCVPGGPMQDSVYLGDVAGLAATHPLVKLDLRGTGASAVPADPATYRCDRQVPDVEALRVRLDLDRMDLFTHSGGAGIAVQYAAQHPEHVNRLVLVCPSPRPVGIDIADADRREVAELRRGEPWFPAAFAAFERVWAGEPTDADWAALAPFSYGRWDADSQAFDAATDEQRNNDAAAVYYSPGSVDPAATRAGLASLDAPVLVIAGEYDPGLPPRRAAEYAGLFATAELVVLPGAGHFPWLDDRAAVHATISDFLG